MILSTVRVEDFDRFWNTFSTKGAEKRKQHGSKGSQVFRDPNDDNRVWVLFDWDEEGYKNLLSDPEMPAIFQEAGLEGRPQTAELARQQDAWLQTSAARCTRLKGLFSSRFSAELAKTRCAPRVHRHEGLDREACRGHLQRCPEGRDHGEEADLAKGGTQVQ